MIKVYACVSDMTGQGEEWLVDAEGRPIAVFIDGQLRSTVSYMPHGNSGETATANVEVS